MNKSVFDFTVKNSMGQDISLSTYKGKVILIVNVASKCGFTPQYEGLENLFREFKHDNFVVLGFPCNQFGAQEPGTNDDIQNFCKMNWDVSFPVMAKVDVNGDKADPLYSFLKSASPGILGTEAIKWNFTKFLIGKDGEVLKRYSPQTEPKDIANDIKEALAK